MSFFGEPPSLRFHACASGGAESAVWVHREAHHLDVATRVSTRKKWCSDLTWNTRISTGKTNLEGWLNVLCVCVFFKNLLPKKIGIVENQATRENEGIYTILSGHLNLPFLEAKSLPYDFNFINK